MADKVQIELVKANTAGISAVEISDEQISALLDAHNSVAYVSYKICLLKSADDAVTLGPIKLSSNEKYWKSLASLYLDEYKAELQNAESKAGEGSTIFMQRADGT